MGLIKTKYDELREQYQSTISFSAFLPRHTEGSFTLSENRFASSRWNINSLQKPEDLYYLNAGYKFIVESIEASILGRNISTVAGTSLQVILGERERYVGLFGSSSEKIFKHDSGILSCISHEFKHRPNGTCDCLEIYPLQMINIKINNINKHDQLDFASVSLIGTLQIPVP